MGIWSSLKSKFGGVRRKRNSPSGLVKLTEKKGRRLVYYIKDGKKATKSLRERGVKVEKLNRFEGEVIKLADSEKHLVENRREIKTWENLGVKGSLEEDLSPIRSFSEDGEYLIMDYVGTGSELTKGQKEKIREFSSNLHEKLDENAEALGILRNDIDVGVINAGWHPELGPVLFDYTLLSFE